jgi:hypothetical protein
VNTEVERSAVRRGATPKATFAEPVVEEAQRSLTALQPAECSSCFWTGPVFLKTFNEIKEVRMSLVPGVNGIRFDGTTGDGRKVLGVLMPMGKR